MTTIPLLKCHQWQRAHTGATRLTTNVTTATEHPVFQKLLIFEEKVMVYAINVFLQIAANYADLQAIL